MVDETKRRTAAIRRAARLFHETRDMLEAEFGARFRPGAFDEAWRFISEHPPITEKERADFVAAYMQREQ